MTNKKKLVVNCATCDLRSLTEQKASCYDRIVINCALATVSPEAQALMARYPITINGASVITLSKGAQFITKNGEHTIKTGSAVPPHPLALLVNGKLTVESGTEEYLANCQAILVNGVLQCPESMLPFLDRATVNGVNEVYPDGARVLKPRFRPDRVFELRAKAGVYYVPRRLILLDEEAAPEALANKGVIFHTPQAVVTSSLLEKVIPLLSEETEISMVPDGTVYVSEELTLDQAALNRYGTKLYVDGDLILEQAHVLSRIEYLEVTGDIEVPEGLTGLLSKTVKCSGEIHTLPEGRIIKEQVSATVDSNLLALCPEGITVMHCAEVTIDPSVSPEEILKLLSIRECKAVICTEAQKTAVSLIVTSVESIGPDAGQINEPVDDSRTVINAAQYSF